MNWNEYITKDFWFGIDRVALHKSDYAVLYLGIALIALSIVMFIYRRYAKNEFLQVVAGKIGAVFMTIGIFEVIWYAARSQYAAVLGTKFVAALILLAGLIWLYGPIKYLFTRYEEDMAAAQRKIQREKYLKR
ncbi:MAG: hypothetical protein M3Q64_01040 [bacterium]|nr:hypothetical protein [bacterium]